MIEWTAEDDNAARAEGWLIDDYRTHMMIDMTMEEACRTVKYRHYTCSAAEHVARRADEGSELHIKALAYVAQQCLLGGLTK